MKAVDTKELKADDIKEKLTDEQVAQLNERSDENKNKKYDRQIRLWGLHGQSRIEKANICLLGAGPAGTETLKNLVLPGVGKFTVIDGEKVTHRDLGNNFFVDFSGLGKSRAEQTGFFLAELNPFVDIEKTIDADPNQLVSTNPDFVQDYTVIIANNLLPSTVLKLSEACEKHGKILVTLRTNGMLGVVRVYRKEHRVCEIKNTDSFLWDLRMHHPWAELDQFVDQWDIQSFHDDIEHKSGELVHTPFIVIVTQALRKYKAEHNDQLPKNEKEKEEFHQLVLSMGKQLQHATNFQEARDNAYLAYRPYSIPSEVLAIIQDPQVDNLTAKSPKFWILARALRDFVTENGGFLPLSGKLPDVSTTAQSYVALQKMYNAKAISDAMELKTFVQAQLKTLGLPETHISDDKIIFFSKQATDLMVTKYSPVSDEFDHTKIKKENIEWWDEKGKWFLATFAAGRFHSELGRLPGDRNSDPMADFTNLKKHSDQALIDLGLEADALEDNYLKEMCRFGGSQIHTTCAYIGGVASQEIIKLLTKQWVPINNTFIYDGISGNAGAISL